MNRTARTKIPTSDAIRSTRFYPEVTVPLVPPPPQSILRRHHTTAAADYSFQRRANADQASYSDDRYVIRPAYLPRHPTTVRGSANDHQLGHEHRSGEKKTVVRFSGDVHDRCNLPSKTSVRDGTTQSYSRAQTNGRRTEGEMMCLTNGMRRLTTRSRSVSDVQLCQAQQRVFGRDYQLTKGSATSGESRQIAVGRENTAFATKGAVKIKQKQRHRKWSSFLMRMTGRKKASKMHLEVNSVTSHNEDALIMTDIYQEVHREYPPIQRYLRSEKSSDIPPQARQSKLDQEPELRCRGRRELRRSSTNSDFNRSMAPQTGRQLYEPLTDRPCSPEIRHRMQIRTSRSGYDFRSGVGENEAYLTSDDAYRSSVDGVVVTTGYSTDDVIATGSISDDSSSGVDYERITDCKSEVTTGPMKFRDENEPLIMASSSGREDASGNECIYAPPDVTTSNYCGDRQREILHSNLTDRYCMKSDYLKTKISANDSAATERPTPVQQNDVIKRTASHVDLMTPKLVAPPPRLQISDAETEFKSMLINKVVRRSESDHVIPNRLPLGPGSLVHSISTFHPKQSIHSGPIYEPTNRKLTINPSRPDVFDAQGHSKNSPFTDRFASSSHCDVTFNAVRLHRDGCHGDVASARCEIDGMKQLELPTRVTSPEEGDYDNLSWENAVQSATGNKNIKHVPEVRPPLPQHSNRTIPKIVVDSVSPEPRQTSTDRNGGLNYIALYAWPPEFHVSRDCTAFARLADTTGSSRRGVEEQSGKNSRPELSTDQREAHGIVSWLHDFTDVFGVNLNRVSDSDIVRIGMFYRSNKTEVIVCACVARLYKSTAVNCLQTVVTTPEIQNGLRWFSTALVGVPVIVIDSGESRCRDRKLYMLLADICSGCSLWREVIDHLSDYRALSSWFHVMRSSRDHTRLAGLLFANENDACDYHGKLRDLTSGPTGDKLLSLSSRHNEKGSRYRRSPSMVRCASFFGGGRLKHDGNKRQIIANLKKSDISAPCCFEHVSTFNRMPAFLATNGLKKSQSDYTFSPSSNSQ